MGQGRITPSNTGTSRALLGLGNHLPGSGDYLIDERVWGRLHVA